MKKYYKLISFVFLGALLGYSYYYFIGCRTGSCPLTSNGYITTVYGAFFGLIFGWDSKIVTKNRVQKEEKADRE